MIERKERRRGENKIGTVLCPHISSHLGLRQKDYLSPGIQVKPGQQSDMPSHETKPNQTNPNQST